MHVMAWHGNEKMSNYRIQMLPTFGEACSRENIFRVVSYRREYCSPAAGKTNEASPVLEEG